MVMARILTVDDDVLALESMKILLEESGHVVVTACDGDDGIKKASLETFDLIITDLIMPNKDGIEMLRYMKREHPTVKVIVVSGGGRTSPDAYLDTAMILGADDTFAKPFAAKDLMASVQTLLT